MFARVTVHGDGFSSLLSAGIRRLVCTVLSLERASPDVQLDLFLLSSRDMQQIHLVSKGKTTPTDALTFSERRDTTKIVHHLLFENPSIRPTDSMVYNPSNNTTSSNRMNGSVSERQLTALRAAQNFEESRMSMLYLGEIYLCPEYMLARINRYPHRSLPFPVYMRAAVVHATLHALGYDHESPVELKTMVRKEQAIGLKLRQLELRHPQLLGASFREAGVEFARRIGKS